MIKFLCYLFMVFTIQFYSQSLKSYQLPAPGIPSSIYNNSNELQNIIYGKTPIHFNGKTLVFIHGFSSTSSTFLINNDMYKEAYNAGYKTAFVSATTGGGDWVNGEILSRAIDQIKAYLKTSTITIIAHSNGGKASEVAMLQYDKNKYIDKIITLSTPFRGTPLADLASNPTFSWLINLLCLGDGVNYSTTYYCDGYFRPYFDNKTNNTPNKFFNIGAWGYNRLFGDSSYLMIPAGGIIYAMGKGKNDGVTPFYSSTRPGGKQIFSSNDYRTYLNHSDVKISNNVWTNIVKPILDGNYDRASKESEYSINNDGENNIRRDDNTEYEVSSDYQILNSGDDSYALIPSISSRYNIQIITDKEKDPINLLDAVTLRSLKQFSASKESESFQKIEKSSSTIQKVKLDTKNNYIAFVSDERNTPMHYSILRGNKLKLEFPKTPNNKLSNIKIKAKAILIGNLQSNVIRQKTSDIFFNKEGDNFIADVNNLPQGIYSLRVSSEIENEFKRDLISGFVISESQKKDYGIAEISQDYTFRLSDNPINDTSSLISSKIIKDDIKMKIYTNFGQMLQEYNIPAKNTRSVLIGQYFSKLTKGIYILEVSSGRSKQHFKIIR